MICCKEIDEYIDSIDEYTYVIKSITTKKVDIISEILRHDNCNIEELNLEGLNIIEIMDFLENNNISDDVKITTDYNGTDKIYCKDIKELSNYLINIKDYVSMFNLSEIEKCLFVYDLLREKKYKFSDYDIQNDNKELNFKDFKEVDGANDSRSLFRVYKSENEVCAGFAAHYKAILDLLDIKSTKIIYNKDKNAGHASIIVYVNDDKYSIHAPLEIDPTWGRKYFKDKSYDYQSTLYSYRNFGLALKTAFQYKETNGLEPSSDIISICAFSKKYDRFKQFISINAPEFVIDDSVQILIDSVAYIIEETGFDFSRELSFLNKAKESDDKLSMLLGIESIKKAIDDKLNYQLQPEEFAKILKHVKGIEHSIDSSKYKFNTDLIQKGIISRYSMFNNFDEIKKNIDLGFIDTCVYEYDEDEEELFEEYGEEFDDIRKEERKNLGLKLISSLRKLETNKDYSNPIIYKR